MAEINQWLAYMASGPISSHLVEIQFLYLYKEV